MFLRVFTRNALSKNFNSPLNQLRCVQNLGEFTDLGNLEALEKEGKGRQLSTGL